jgi:Short-chain dehydrogenases of various substrate specificities
MAQRGCEISLVARNQEKLDLTLSNLKTDQGQQHQTVCVDFDQPEIVKDKVTSHIGSLGKNVDILVNNSGGPHGGPPH